MKILLKQFAVFLLPLGFIYAFVIFIIDPFSYFDIIETYSEYEKTQIVGHGGKQLRLLNLYNKQPASIVFIGDSRVESFSSNTIKKYMQEYFFNFSMAGASSDHRAIFEYINSLCKIKTVYIGVSLHSSGQNKGDPFKQVSENHSVKNINRVKNGYFFYGYQSFKFGLEVLFHSVISKKTKENANLAISSKNNKLYRNKQWRNVLKSYGYDTFNDFSLSKNTIQNIQFIGNYCKKHRIKLVFILFPHHDDVYECIRVTKSEEQHFLLKKVLKENGNLIDFDYSNNLTHSLSNFTDPFHTNREVTDSIIKEILTQQFVYAKFYPLKEHEDK